MAVYRILHGGTHIEDLNPFGIGLPHVVSFPGGYIEPQAGQFFFEHLMG